MKITVKEYAKRNGLHVRSVLMRIKRGQLPAEPFDRTFVIDERLVWSKYEPFVEVRNRWEEEGLTDAD